MATGELEAGQAIGSNKRRGCLWGVTGRENRGLGKGNSYAFYDKTNHQEHGFSRLRSPINACCDKILI